MTVAEFIQAKLASFNVELSNIEMQALLVDNGITESSEYESKLAKTVLTAIIPELLLKPDISEGGFSINFDKLAIEKYYAILCQELGIQNKLVQQPKVSNKSNLW